MVWKNDENVDESVTLEFEMVGYSVVSFENVG